MTDLNLSNEELIVLDEFIKKAMLNQTMLPVSEAFDSVCDKVTKQIEAKYIPQDSVVRMIETIMVDPDFRTGGAQPALKKIKLVVEMMPVKWLDSRDD